ncbi:ribosomal protein S2, flavodoxin-like domain-containing protein [Spinellus fusiger]|nr:ribosomal protein S2, flavodoxin-like domain-containing protein [Spinellus fusiger]
MAARTLHSGLKHIHRPTVALCQSRMSVDGIHAPPSWTRSLTTTTTTTNTPPPGTAETLLSSSSSTPLLTLESLLPPVLVKTPLRKKVERPPVTPHTLTIASLLSTGLHLGHATSLWEPTTLPFIFGTREGISIINLEHTLVHLKRACNVARDISQRGGTLLFIGTRPGLKDLTIDAARHCEGYHVSSKWIPGTLTNAHQVLGRHASPDPEDPGRVPRTYRPDLIVLLNPLENRIAISEAQLHKIPIVAITDTDYDPRRVTYPIPANDDSVRGVALVAHVIASAAKEGVVRRKQVLNQKAREARAMREDLSLNESE